MPPDDLHDAGCEAGNTENEAYLPAEREEKNKDPQPDQEHAHGGERRTRCRGCAIAPTTGAVGAGGDVACAVVLCVPTRRDLLDLHAVSETRLLLTCGLPGAGKTTLATRLAAERRAVRLTKDEWQWALGSTPWDRATGEKIEQELSLGPGDLEPRAQCRARLRAMGTG